MKSVQKKLQEHKSFLQPKGIPSTSNTWSEVREEYGVPHAHAILKEMLTAAHGGDVKECVECAGTPSTTQIVGGN